MSPIRLSFFAATLTLLSVAYASAAPAYVPSTVNLRTAAGTGNEVVAKIPGGSLVDVGTCTEGWCEVEWQDKKGFAIATALDRSGRVPGRTATGSARVPAAVAGPRYVEVDPPIAYGPPVMYGPPVYGYPYYRYGYRYGPYWGYRRWRYW